jgi:oligopeptide transport system substrate-binding protein
MDTSWWSGFADPHDWMNSWTCGDELFATIIGYCNPDYDALVQKADRERDPDKRIALAEASQWQLVADAPAIFAYTFDTILLVKPHVTSYSRHIPNQSWPGLYTPLSVDITRPT